MAELKKNNPILILPDDSDFYIKKARVLSYVYASILILSAALMLRYHHQILDIEIINYLSMRLVENIEFVGNNYRNLQNYDGRSGELYLCILMLWVFAIPLVSFMYLMIFIFDYYLYRPDIKIGRSPMGVFIKASFFVLSIIFVIFVLDVSDRDSMGMGVFRVGFGYILLSTVCAYIMPGFLVALPNYLFWRAVRDR